jgi:hypothetical protein
MSEITYRRLASADFERIGEIDRTERIDTLYVQHGDRLSAISARRRGSPKGMANTRLLTSAPSASGISPQVELHWERLRMANS